MYCDHGSSTLPLMRYVLCAVCASTALCACRMYMYVDITKLHMQDEREKNGTGLAIQFLDSSAQGVHF